MMKKQVLAALLILSLLLCACGSGQNENSSPAAAFSETAAAVSSSSPEDASVPGTTAFAGENVQTGGRDAIGENGVVATGREDATQIGIDILKAGGNAVDAAVAIGFALGVSEQQSSGIGGGGFMTIRFAQTGEVVFIDFRDVSGAGASLDHYEVLENGLVKDQANKIGALSIAVPGEVKGMLYALDTYGTMDRQTVMQPAIDLAENGFTVSHITSRDIKDAYPQISLFDATAAIYFDEDWMPWEAGAVITNPDLAATA